MRLYEILEEEFNSEVGDIVGGYYKRLLLTPKFEKMVNPKKYYPDVEKNIKPSKRTKEEKSEREKVIQKRRKSNKPFKPRQKKYNRSLEY